MNILIADDHASIRTGVIELLRTEFNFAEFHEAGNGKEVMSLIHGHDWSVVVMDISMPSMNGLETVRQLRAAYVMAPVVMLSMHPADPYEMHSLLAGASGYVNKDMVTEELIPAILKVLSRGD
jgi:DNA-binding NarL/FixJ family response regulator